MSGEGARNEEIEEVKIRENKKDSIIDSMFIFRTLNGSSQRSRCAGAVWRAKLLDEQEVTSEAHSGPVGGRALAGCRGSQSESPAKVPV